MANETAPDGRKPLRPNVSKISFERWHSFARHHGVSVTGFADAIGEALNPDTVTLDLVAVVERARQIDGARRERQ